MDRCPLRSQWLEALPYFKESAPDGATLDPPTSDEDMVGFLDELWHACAHRVGGPCVKLLPKDRMGMRPQLKRVYKKYADQGGPNPNYGRFYLTNHPETPLKYFEWLTETMWWRSFMYKRCLPEQIVREMETTGGPIDAPLWTGTFLSIYGSELSIDEIANQGGESQTSVVSGTPLHLPPIGVRNGRRV